MYKTKGNKRIEMCKKEELKRQKGSGTTEGKQKVKRSFNPWAGIKSAQSVN